MSGTRVCPGPGYLGLGVPGTRDATVSGVFGDTPTPSDIATILAGGGGIRDPAVQGSRVIPLRPPSPGIRIGSPSQYGCPLAGGSGIAPRRPAAEGKPKLISGAMSTQAEPHLSGIKPC